MRFAYIDSQGKEVGIPSVEALQLRIELGAITEDTMFYDESADRWAIAGEHEVYRSLSREIQGRDAEALRPSLPDLWQADAPAGSEREGEGSFVSDPFEMEQDPLDPEEPLEVKMDDIDPIETEALSSAGLETEADSSSDDSAISEVDLGDLPELDAIDVQAGSLAPEGGFEAGPDPSDDLELEVPLSEQGGSEEPFPADSGLDLEEPLTDQDFSDLNLTLVDPEEEYRKKIEDQLTLDPTDEEPHPFDEEAPAPPERSSSPIPPHAGSGRMDPYDRRPRPPGAGAAPPLTARPRRSRRGSPWTGALAMGGGVVVLAGAGWFAWSALVGGGDEGAGPEVVVEIPELPAELEAPMRDIRGAAYVQLLDSIRGLSASAALDPEPVEEWLAGIYLARASQYESVSRYWESFRGFLDQVRANDEALYASFLESAAAESDLEGQARDTVLVRAEAGFRATAPDRARVYDQLEALIDAAVGLHDFLVANERDISYEPAVGISRDPVTEAIASSQALSDEMWSRVERITTALDALGTLDRVTTERVLEVFGNRLESIGVR